jgi:hypothetical protein
MKLVDKFFDDYKKEIKEYVDKNQMDNPIENKLFRDNVGKVIKQKTYSTGLLTKLLALIAGIAGCYAYYDSQPKISNIESFFKSFKYEPNPIEEIFDFSTLLLESKILI